MSPKLRGLQGSGSAASGLGGDCGNGGSMVALLKRATAIQLQLTVAKRECGYFVTTPFIALKKLEIHIFM